MKIINNLLLLLLTNHIQNTNLDFKDCISTVVQGNDGDELSKEERKALKRLCLEAITLLEYVGYEVNTPDDEDDDEFINDNFPLDD